VIDIDCILGPAAITRDVATPIILRGLLPKCRLERKSRYEHAREDSKGNPGSGSEVYVINSAVMKCGVSENHLYEPTSDNGEEL